MMGIVLAIWGLTSAVMTIYTDSRLFVNKRAVRFWLLVTFTLFFLSLLSEVLK